MKKIIAIFTALAMCLSLVSCKGLTTEEKTLLDKMTLEEKVGQILFVRCVEDEMIDDLMGINPGGILMFQRDFDGLTKDEVISKIEGFQAKSEIPLIIGADEEGGTVVRVSANPNLAPEKYKSPQDIYNEGGMEAVVANAKEKSELLLSLGVNMNLAPVADVSTNPDTFIYKRSFGKGYEETADFISQTVTAMENTGIWSVLKHFPGYGEVTGDTHKGTVYNEKSAEDIRSTDLVPFKAGIDAGASCVLVSHNTVNGLDSE
ncbi:MAG: glycoside hydrolase family 3 N-terminal domain-containing protein, partial [Hominilimicola sp.]